MVINRLNHGLILRGRDALEDAENIAAILADKKEVRALYMDSHMAVAFIMIWSESSLMIAYKKEAHTAHYIVPLIIYHEINSSWPGLAKHSIHYACFE